MAKKDYHSLTNELDSLLESLQAAEMDIDAAVKAYERGMVIVNELEALLKDAENKVVKVTSTDE